MTFDRKPQASSDASTTGTASDATMPGKRTLIEDLPSVAPVQRAVAPGAISEGSAPYGGSVQAAAERGTSGPSTELPYRATIQSLFGPHDVSKVQAHVGGAAAEGAAAMGARAFATGDHVAFASAPDLHTAAHEAAHVVQQRRGVQLKGGVGEVGDPYERNADEVADRVVAGRSAADLLAPYAGGGGAGGAHAGVQRIVEPGAKVGIRVFVTLGDGRFAVGNILKEVPGQGYLVNVDGRKEQFAYAQLNLHDPRETDAALGGDKWREYVRGDHQSKGPTAYDNDGTDFGRRLDAGKSYGASMTAAQGKVSNSLGKPMSPGYVQDLHDTGSAHLSHPPDWRNERSGNGYDGRIGVTLHDHHADAQGTESLRQSGTMTYQGRGGGAQMTNDGQMMMSGPVTHHIATAPMSSESVQGALEAITATYYETIGVAQTQDQILDAIARFTQDLARLHPFEDANTRTNMLLLNKLLAENGFPLAIVDDPKHFYLNKLSAWREKIVAGMQRWKSLGGERSGKDEATSSVARGKQPERSGKDEAMSSVARGKQPERRPDPSLHDGHDDHDVEVRPIEELFEGDPDGLEEFRTGMAEVDIAHNAAIIQQRRAAIASLQAEVAELHRLFGTYASLVAQASNGIDAIEDQVDRSEANTQDAERHLH